MKQITIGICALFVLTACSDWNRLKKIEDAWEDARDSALEDSEQDGDTETNSLDTETESETVTDPQTDSDSTAETETEEDSHSEFESDSTSETEETTDTSCTAQGCHGENPFCDTTSGTCVQCLEDQHCAGNFTCDTTFKVCNTSCSPPGNGCVEGHYCESNTCLAEKQNGHACAGNDFECVSQHCENSYCCGGGSCCATHNDCASLTYSPICSTEFQCTGCGDEKAPADGCAQGYPSKPHCKTGDNICVECNNHGDCYLDPEGTADEHRPYLSPLGACTPDNTCTCWVPQGDTTTNCENCAAAGEGFVCARDFDDGKVPIPNIHAACLRKCADQSFQSPAGGLRCEKSAGIEDYIWMPAKKASCYSFKKFGSPCPSESNAACSVDGTNPISDGICNDFGGEFGYRCTYSCWDDNSPVDEWCPQGCISGGAFSRCDYAE